MDPNLKVAEEVRKKRYVAPNQRTSYERRPPPPTSSYERRQPTSYERHQFQRQRYTSPTRPRFGRGYWVNKNDFGDGDNEPGRNYRKPNRPLVPENKTDLERWEPIIMSTSEIGEIAKSCIEVTDEFIRLDTFLDRTKLYNSSNHDQLREEQRMCQAMMDVQPKDYQELIAQCEANPDKFPGTQYLLKLVLGEDRLAEYIREREWTEEYLKEWSITKDWQMFDKKVSSEESMLMDMPPRPLSPYSISSAGTGWEKVIEQENI